MRFDWDEAKRLANIKKHGVDFADIVTIFENDVFTIGNRSGVHPTFVISTEGRNLLPVVKISQSLENAPSK